MKKFLSFILLFIFALPLTAYGASPFVSLEPYPYFSHVLGEDLVIYGDTNLHNVVITLNYPDDEQGYLGKPKYYMTITREELKNGHVIKTGLKSRLWPEGVWTVSVGNSTTNDTVHINMREDSITRQVRLAEYENGALTGVESYQVRGLSVHNSVMTLPLEGNSSLKIFSWNNLSPSSSGQVNLFVTIEEDDFPLSIRNYSGLLSSFSDSICLEGESGKSLKLFMWNDSLSPVKIP